MHIFTPVVWSVLLGTALSGIGSVWIAWAFVQAVLSKYTQHLLSLSAGALLATAFLHLLPEAFESAEQPRALFATLLIGILFFFLMDKAELWHHGHEHHHHDPERHQGNDQLAGLQHDHAGHEHGSLVGGWAVLIGDSLHCFGDGVLVAAAFMADYQVGLVASLAVWMHEVPHHMGDLVVLRASSSRPERAVFRLSVAGGITVVGGVVGLLSLDGHARALPYLLALASSSYIYVSLADLIPQLQRKLSALQTLAQLFWLALGMILVNLTSHLA